MGRSRLEDTRKEVEAVQAEPKVGLALISDEILLTILEDEVENACTGETLSAEACVALHELRRRSGY